MSWLFTIAIILFVIAAIAAIISLFLKSSSYGDPRKVARIVAVVVGLIGVAFTAMACLTSVPAKSVGVVTSFGKPVRHLGPGVHIKWPWQVVHDMDGAIQIDDNLGQHRTEIRLGNQANAYVQNALRWQIKTDAAERLYSDYREFDHIGPGLVDQELAKALNSAFANYDPLHAAQGQGQTLDQISDQVEANLKASIGDRIIIDAVIIPKVDFDDATQARINAYQQEIGNTKIAQQRVQTAEQERQVNQKLAAQVSKDPNVLVAKCIDAVARGVQVPPGFQCWPNAGGSTIVGGR
jgi:regulator of protease activity HflC (stomatin/prohibitin superfamily)